MSSTFLIRSGGRVSKTGRSAADLRSLAARKRLSRMTEVSSDGGNTWRKAGEIAEIFPPTAPAPSVAVARTSRVQPSAPSETEWHYGLDGQEFGPVTQSHLESLISDGRLGPNDMVWNESMSNWSRIAQCRDFAHLAPRRTTTQAVTPTQTAPVAIQPTTAKHEPNDFRLLLCPILTFILPLLIAVATPILVMAFGTGTTLLVASAFIIEVIVILCAVCALFCGHTLLSDIARSGTRHRARGIVTTAIVVNYICIAALFGLNLLLAQGAEFLTRINP